MSCEKFSVNCERFVCSDVSKVKVTAVKFVNKYLYVGIGGDLNVYKIDSNFNYTLLLKRNVLIFNNIYGIHADCNEKNIVVYGGKLFRVLPSYPTEWPCEFPWKVNGWIWHIKWLYDSTFAIIMGHNELSIFRWSDRVTLNLIESEEKCILYSGFVIGDNFNDNLVVLSGTVYKEVLLWIPSLKKNENDKTVVHRLKGHNGVLFSVNYNLESQCICSTSDDRTVRLWKISLPSAYQPDNSHIHGRLLSLNEWKLVLITPLYCVFGHLARVFRSCMISDNRILSIGEDSYLCVWDGSGKIILKQETHQGGAVCCVDYCEPLKVAVTGGADGGVNFWPLLEVLPSNNHDHDSNPSLSLLPVIPSRIKLLNNNKILLTGRNSSRLYVYESSCNWVNIFEDIRILNYCLLDVSPCRKFIALATIQGDLIVLKETNDTNFTKILDKRITENKIFSLHWLTENFLLCCGNEGMLSVCEVFNEKDYDDHLYCMKFKSRLRLPICKERWLTSAVLCCNVTVSGDDEKLNQLLICGDRCGSMHVYDLNQESEEPLQTLYKIHGRLGISCIFFYDNYIFSTGRDGCLRQFTIEKNCTNKYLQLTPVSIDKLTLPWGAKIVYTNYLGYLVLGFHEKDLVIWSVRSRVGLWRLECGGGHREWDCSVNDDVNEINFFYVKNKSIKLISKKLKTVACPPLMDGLHTREINALVLLTCFTTDDGLQGAIFVSGSEDTMIRVSYVSSILWQPILLLSGHLSSIRTIATLTINSADSNVNKYLLFTAGGRAQLKIWSLSLDFNVKPFQLRGVECCSYMLKKNEKVRRPWREALPTIDPETRFMDLSVEFTLDDMDRNTVLVFAACSDGYLRIFMYDILSNKLEIIYLFEYGRCLLKTLNINFYENIYETFTSYEEFSMHSTPITTSTDGNLAFWNIAHEQPVSLVKAHQSGVNSIDVVLINCSENTRNNESIRGVCYQFLIASGGDDCSIAVNLFRTCNKTDHCSDYTVVDTSFKLHNDSNWSSNSLHSSQVSGIKIVDNFIISAGVDQRINVLSWSLDNNKLSVNFVTQYTSVIADIHGIEAWRKSKGIIAVCAFGVGAEVISIDTAVQ